MDRKIYENSLKMNYYCFSEQIQVKNFQAKIFEKIKNQLQTRRNRSEELSKKYLDAIVCNIVIGMRSHKFIAIPKGLPFYCDELNFEHEKISYRVFTRILNSLVDLGYVWEAKGFTNYEQSYISVFGATAKFKELFGRASLAEIHAPLSPQVILRSKRIKSLPFKETPPITELRSKIQKINALYRQNVYSTILDDESEPIQFYPRISAIFNNRSFSCGGRLYCKPQRGISFQSLHKSERAKILINGKSTVELDYSGLHLNMLYAQEGIQLTGSPYTFLGEQSKPMVKKAILILLNASDEQQALNALKRKFPTVNADELLTAIKDYHSRISKYFCSGCWMNLQYKDAKMAVAILDYFLKKNISVLPIHDSFIISSDYSDELKSIMEQTYSEYNSGFFCAVK